VPVTAKLSRKFYEKLGDDVANELVEWFNSVDATYRSDLKELNELNFARFDAKVEQRWAQLDAKVEQRVAELRAEMRAGFVAADAKLERRLAELGGPGGDDRGARVRRDQASRLEPTGTPPQPIHAIAAALSPRARRLAPCQPSASPPCLIAS